MEVLSEFVLEYFVWFPMLCPRLLRADDGMQLHLCVHIFINSSRTVAISFTLQIDCHAAVTVNTVVPVIDFFYLLLYFCFLSIVIRLPVFPVVIVGIRVDLQPPQQPAGVEFLMVRINEPVSL